MRYVIETDEQENPDERDPSNIADDIAAILGADADYSGCVVTVGGPAGDYDALDRIAAMLRESGPWSAGMLEDVAEIVASTGRDLTVSAVTP